MADPKFVQEMKAIEWNREDFTLEEQWQIAQKWEVEFHAWHILEKKKCATRADRAAKRTRQKAVDIFKL